MFFAILISLLLIYLPALIIFLGLGTVIVAVVVAVVSLWTGFQSNPI